MGSTFILPRDLMDYLEDYGISSLAQARNHTSSASGYWFSYEELDLSGEWKIAWDNYIRGLEYGCICLNNQIDSISRSHFKYTGPLITAEGYKCILSDICSEINDSVLKILWTLSIPLKLKCFIWLILKGKILTWDQLQSRGFMGPSRCVLC